MVDKLGNFLATNEDFGCHDNQGDFRKDLFVNFLIWMSPWFIYENYGTKLRMKIDEFWEVSLVEKQIFGKMFMIVQKPNYFLHKKVSKWVN